MVCLLKMECLIVRKITLSLFLGASLSACASITAGTTQSVGIDTTPKQGAECKLSNEKGSWSVSSTPASTTVTKAHGPLTASCKTNDGWSGAKSVESSTAAASFGNIIAGGVIGAAVDMGTGAAYIYPAEIVVNISPPVGAQAAPALVRCQVKQAEMHTDTETCKRAGGKLITAAPAVPSKG